MNRLVLIFFLLGNMSFSHGQIGDSLFRAWQDVSLADTLRLAALRQFTTEIRKTDPDSAINLAWLMLEMARSGGYRELEYRAYTSLGISHAFMGNYGEAIQNFQKSLEIAESINNIKGALSNRVNIANIYYQQGNYRLAQEAYENTAQKAALAGDTVTMESAINNLGNIHFQQGNLDTALSYYEKSLMLATRINRRSSMAMANSNIGLILSEKGRYIEALEYLLRSREIKEEREDAYGLASELNSIGMIFFLLEDYEKAFDYWDQHRYLAEMLKDKNAISISMDNFAALYSARKDHYQALDYARKGLALTEEIGNKIGQASAHTRIANIYNDLGRNEEARQAYHLAMEIYRELDVKSSMAAVYVSLGNISLKDKSFNTARRLCTEALDYASAEGMIETMKEACKCISGAWEGLGNYQNALLYHKHYLQYRDSLFNEAKTKEITRLELNYAFEKEREADSIVFANEKTLIEAKLKRERDKRIFIIVSGSGGIVLLGILGFLFWRSGEQKRRIDQQEKDLQKEREIVERLKQIDHLKDQFLANTSHELRTPLSGIIGLSESLIDGIAGNLPGEVLQNINLIRASGKRLSNLVNDILDFSKLKNKDIKLQLGPVDLHAITDMVIMISRPLVSGKPLKLLNEIPEDLPFAHADEDRVQQILYNLIGNAIKFTEQGEIRISGEIREDEILISVSDTGIGIPEDKLTSIFASFEQVHGGDARHYEGTGLGLTITKQLVELHHGRIHVISEQGKGSTFTFTLPVSLSLDKEDAVPDQSSGRIPLLNDIEYHPVTAGVKNWENRGQPVGYEKARILIVDDEPVIRQVLENQLQLGGYEVLQADSGAEALNLVMENELPDLIILDIMMPRMSGYEVCKNIREKHGPALLPILMLTAKNRVSDLVEGLEAGANDYIAKPFSKEELLSRVKTHLNLQRINVITNKFVPGEFLKSIGHQSITEVKLGDHIEKEFTVFFSDIRNYTTIAEQMSPKENFNFINEYVGMMGPVIHKNHGFVHQYLGDAIVGIFPNESEKALRASIEMQKAIRKYNGERKHKKMPLIQVGMGLHSGQLIMGVIGDQFRNDPATISDTVNAASRMEGITKFFGALIILSEGTYEKISDPEEFNLRYLGKVQLKGKMDSMGAYECFDGDDPDTLKRKIETQHFFNDAMDNFLNREFAEATALFNRIIKSNPGDLVSKHFRQKSAHYTVNGVPDDWDGIEKLLEK
ncbi:MAG: tetratricopeptide repeat protein [Cyclobacteriaceae bacterium]|nr:tetratricopeptide repeat protein [Cyclobacteriaceae bacterium]